MVTQNYACALTRMRKIGMGRCSLLPLAQHNGAGGHDLLGADARGIERYRLFSPPRRFADDARKLGFMIFMTERPPAFSNACLSSAAEPPFRRLPLLSSGAFLPTSPLPRRARDEIADFRLFRMTPRPRPRRAAATEMILTYF